MRKTIFTALVTLLVMLAVVSCDSNFTGQDEDGLVTLNVNTGGTGSSRTITDALAKQEANYVEVIFAGSDSKYYRANGYQGAKLKVKVPAGTYNNTNTLILIGKKSNGTLLAFGTSDTTGVTVGGTNPSDPTINFSALSIVTKISADSDTDFVIDTTNIATVNPLFTTTVINNGVLYDDDAKTTCFQVPTGVVAGTYSAGIKVTLSLKTANFTGLGNRIKIVDPSTATPVTITPIIGSPAISLISNSVKPASTDTDVSYGKIEFAFNTTTDEGRYSITFDIPVVGYDSTTVAGTGTAPLTWHIRGGSEEGYDFTETFYDTVPLRVTATPTSPKFGIIANPGH